MHVVCRYLSVFSECVQRMSPPPPFISDELRTDFRQGYPSLRRLTNLLRSLLSRQGILHPKRMVLSSDRLHPIFLRPSLTPLNNSPLVGNLASQRPQTNSLGSGGRVLNVLQLRKQRQRNILTSFTIMNIITTQESNSTVSKLF